MLPAATVILLALFAVQPFGTSAIGRAFGPIMLVWFVIIAALGVYGIMQHPQVFVAINPLYGLDYLMRGGAQGFLVLGGVFLCVTGAEALYADMGHFGPGPIRLSWSFVVFPALILNYAGQAAIVLAGAPTEGNIFYRLCPAPLLTPLIVLATIATVIASQSIITGAYSMTRQAIQLGWLPRMTIKQTSEEGYGQIYVGTVNWLAHDRHARPDDRLRQVRQSSRRLRHCGVGDDADDERAPVHRDARRSGTGRSGGGSGSWLSPRRRQLPRRQYGEGAWTAAGSRCCWPRIVYGLMWIWHRGATAVQTRVESEVTPLSTFIALLNSRQDRARARLGRVLHPRQGSDPPRSLTGTCATAVRCTKTR